MDRATFHAIESYKRMKVAESAYERCRKENEEAVIRVPEKEMDLYMTKTAAIDKKS